MTSAFSASLPQAAGAAIRSCIFALLAALLGAASAARPATAMTAPRRPAASPSVKVTAKVQRGTVGRREDVVYVLTVEGASLSEIDFPEAPSAPGLVPESRQPEISQDAVYQGGHLRRTVAFRWTYRPRRAGTVRFAPVSFAIDGDTYRTETVSVRVLAQARSSAASSRDDARSADSDDDIFIEATLSDSTLYRGGQTTVTYRLFYRRGLQLRQSRLAGSWDAPGFWREELDVPSRPDVGTTHRGGEEYKTLLLKRVALFPTRTGRLTLSPLEIETRARRPGRSRGGLLQRLFSSGRSREVSVTSDSAHLRVRPLPDGAPASFQGTVGRFRMDLSRSTQIREVRVGQSVVLKLEISGYGNLATLKAPALEKLSDHFETYPPDARLDIDRDGTRIRGTKTFTYTLVPQERGSYEIPPIAFSYFDPDAGRYRTLHTHAVTVRATGSAGELSASSGKLPAGDLAGPLTESVAWARPGGSPLYRRVWPYAALGLPALLAVALLAWRRRRARVAARPPEAHPTARRRLRKARRHLERDRPRAFYEETERALRAFVGQRLDAPATGQTRRQLRDAFTHVGVAAGTQNRFFALLDECDRARFAPTAPDREALTTASDRAHRLVAALDEALPPASVEPAPARA